MSYSSKTQILQMLFLEGIQSLLYLVMSNQQSLVSPNSKIVLKKKNEIKVKSI